jgi:7 transmembrane sweet-taste receptor of 3 GCPR
VGPLVVLVLAALLILSLWTALDPLQWSRVEINEITGESFGQCTDNSSGAFLIPLMVVVVIPTFLTLFMAWKTKDVDKAYSESKWIFSLVLLQLEVIIFAVPVIVILRGVSTDGKYLGMVIIVWSLPMSTLGLIMVPKYLAYWRIEHTTNDMSRSK